MRALAVIMRGADRGRVRVPVTVFGPYAKGWRATKREASARRAWGLAGKSLFLAAVLMAIAIGYFYG